MTLRIADFEVIFSCSPFRRSRRSCRRIFFPAGFADADGLVERLGHVVDGERGDGRGGEGLHLDAGVGDGRGVARDGDAPSSPWRYVHEAERERVAHGDELRCALGGLDAGEACDLEWIALGIFGQGLEDGRGELDEGGGDGLAAGGCLALTSTMWAGRTRRSGRACRFLSHSVRQCSSATAAGRWMAVAGSRWLSGGKHGVAVGAGVGGEVAGALPGDARTVARHSWRQVGGEEAGEAGCRLVSARVACAKRGREGLPASARSKGATKQEGDLGGDGIAGQAEEGQRARRSRRREPPKTTGLPGCMRTPVKRNSAPRSASASSTRSYLPAETPPESSSRSEDLRAVTRAQVLAGVARDGKPVGWPPAAATSAARRSCWSCGSGEAQAGRRARPARRRWRGWRRGARKTSRWRAEAAARRFRRRRDRTGGDHRSPRGLAAGGTMFCRGARRGLR